MKKRRKKRLHWVFKPVFGCLLVLILIPGGCCLFVFFPRGPTHRPPYVSAERKDAQGNSVQRIILEQTLWRVGYLPGPHGFMPNNHVINKYFLEQPGKPRFELTFLEHTDIPRWRFWAVDQDSLWVSVDFTDRYPRDSSLKIVVFDDTHMLHSRTIPCKDLQSGDTYRFENGNRTLVYWTGKAFEGYDVATDTVAPWKPPKN